jgi:uncharacterized protein YciI
MSSQSMSAEERAAEVGRIRDRMIKTEFFIMHRKSIAPERKAAVLLEHFQWLVRMEKEGHIVMTGGIFQRDGTQTEGMTIFRAAGWEAAERLASSDPVIACGADSFHLERFRLGAGRLRITLDFSDQTYRLE